jgi:hypothetical protein
MTGELLRQLLPHLMRCLPDWPAIEQGGAPSPVPEPRTT